jgi:hypothetical protein
LCPSVDVSEGIEPVDEIKGIALMCEHKIVDDRLRREDLEPVDMHPLGHRVLIHARNSEYLSVTTDGTTYGFQLGIYSEYSCVLTRHN